MPAYNFQARFAPFVESGEKPCTIRLPRKRPTEPRDNLTLYVGMRTKGCRLLRREKCLAVVPIHISTSGTLYFHRRQFTPEETEHLARLDTGNMLGHEGFIDFFRTTYGLPFRGELIQFLPHPWLDELTGRLEPEARIL